MQYIINGCDMWEGESTAVSQKLLLAFQTMYFTQPSSNHNNERLVKIASRIISTGKSEIMGNIYFIAANHFMGNILDEENDNNNDDDDAIDINASTNTPQQRKKRSIQRHNKGFLRLDAIATTLQRKELMNATAHFYLPESKRDSKLVINNLKSKAKNIKQQKELDNVSGLMEFHGQEKLNAKIL